MQLRYLGTLHKMAGEKNATTMVFPFPIDLLQLIPALPAKARSQTAPHMKTLFLLRHANPSWKNTRLDDHERPLNERGCRVTKTMAEHLQRVKVPGTHADIVKRMPSMGAPRQPSEETGEAPIRPLPASPRRDSSAWHKGVECLP
jgi:hypothetical protein